MLVISDIYDTRKSHFNIQLKLCQLDLMQRWKNKRKLAYFLCIFICRFVYRTVHLFRKLTRLLQMSLLQMISFSKRGYYIIPQCSTNSWISAQRLQFLDALKYSLQCTADALSTYFTLQVSVIYLYCCVLK